SNTAFSSAAQKMEESVRIVPSKFRTASLTSTSFPPAKNASSRPAPSNSPIPGFAPIATPPEKNASTTTSAASGSEFANEEKSSPNSPAHPIFSNPNAGNNSAQSEVSAAETESSVSPPQRQLDQIGR